MKTSKTLIWLASLAGLLALISACAGLFWRNGGSPFTFTSLHNQEVQMYGRGIYHNDALLSAGTFIGTDAVTIFLMVPLLGYALRGYARGSLRGGLLLVSALGFFLYNSIHMALAVAYNNLFLVYVAFFSASLFAFILSFTSIDLQDLAARVSSQMPRRGPAIFLIIAGVALALVWLSDILPPLLQNSAPLSLASYTTSVTYAIDLAIIVPTTILTGVLLLRSAPLGYLLGVILLVVNAIVGIVVVVQTVAQLAIGVPLTPAIVAVFVAPFIVMAFFAGWFTIGMLRNIEDTGNSKLAVVRTANA